MNLVILRCQNIVKMGICMRRRFNALLLATVLLYSAIAAVYGDSTYMVQNGVYAGEGIGINTKAQVLDKEGNIIPGLYAAEK